MAKDSTHVRGKLPPPGQVLLEAGIPPVHPGVYFFEQVLRPRGIEVIAAAEQMDLPVETLKDIIAQRRPVDQDIANRLGGFTETRPRVWLNIQAATDYAAANGR